MSRYVHACARRERVCAVAHITKGIVLCVAIKLGCRSLGSGGLSRPLRAIHYNDKRPRGWKLM